MTGKVQKTLHYKAAEFQGDGKLSLELLLAKAIKSRPTARSRQEEQDLGGEKNYRLINRVEDRGRLLCGVMMSYTEGVHQNVVAVSPEAPYYDLTQIPPALDGADAQAEFVEGLLFFGIKRNHVVILASTHLHTKAFEDHLRWLLRETNELAPETKLYVTDRVKPDFSDRRYKGLKSIKITSELQFEESEIQAGSSETKTFALVPKGRAWKGIGEILASIGAETPDVNFQGGLAPEDLEVTLFIRAKHRRRTKANVVTPVLDPIANNFRHFEDPPVQLEFLDGTKIQGDQFKIRTRIGIESINGMPDPTNVFQNMDEWFAQLLLKGDIEAE